jgi:cell division protein FtsB
MTTDVKPTPPTTKPRLTRRGLNISGPQVVLILGVVFALSVIINFSARIQTEQRISAEANQLRGEVTALAATQAAQATELAFVSSDAYVAQWAHGDGRMVQAGEVLVVPVPSANATPTPVPAPVAQPTPTSNVQIWWELFFSNES